VTVETATYISDLNAALPGASDNESEGDDHMRLIKAAVKATFPNVTGAVTPTHTQLNQLATNTFTSGMSGTTHVLSAQPSFNAQRTGSTLGINGGVVTDILFNTANSNVSSSYATGTGIFTAPTTGVYAFAAGVILQNSSLNTATINDLYLSKNNDTAGTTGLYFPMNMTVAQGASLGPSGGAFTTSGTVVVAMTAGDTMRVKCSMGGSFGIGCKVGSYFCGYQLC
jgi:hypothetical protein